MTKTLPRPRCRLQLETLEDRLVPSADMVLQWNDILRDAVRTAGTPATCGSRIMAITQAAVYDSVNALDRTHEVYLVDALAHPQASREAAVAAAAHRALVTFYPAQAAALDAKLTASLATIPDGKAEDDGVALGRSVADQILALRQNDGSGVVLPPYLGGTEPGEWRPTPPANSPGLAPHWPDVTPFAMTSGDQFRPAAPPALDSAEYTAAFNEVKELGSATSATRTADQTAMAQFWNNGAAPGSPGHLNLLAQIVAEQQGNTLEENARLFAALNIAMADAVISCWDAKYEYNFWRPVTGIREAADDGNPDTAADAAWTPLISTPAHPSYISGHSTVSGAAAAVLADFFGTDNISFTLPSQNPALARPLLHQLLPGGGGVGRQPALRRHPLELRQQRRPDRRQRGGRVRHGQLPAARRARGGGRRRQRRADRRRHRRRRLAQRRSRRHRAGGLGQRRATRTVRRGRHRHRRGRPRRQRPDPDFARRSTPTPRSTAGPGTTSSREAAATTASSARTAADMLLGHSGNDRLDGGAGDDFLFGGLGDDVLLGGLGDDWLFGGPGLDVLDGGPGHNRLFP